VSQLARKRTINTKGKEEKVKKRLTRSWCPISMPQNPVPLDIPCWCMLMKKKACQKETHPK
jgi:hypothetical protein